jgi:excisionase family DNA binding protein
MDNRAVHPLPDKLLTPKEVSAKLSVSLSKVYQLLHTGDIHFVRIGRSVRVDPTDLFSFIELHKSQQIGISELLGVEMGAYNES